MSKAVIVLDMPKSCWKCRFQVLSDLYSLEEEYVCEVECRALKESTMKNKPKWCPLKPMPQKKNTEMSLNAMNDWLEHSERVGFNKCVDELVGWEE